MDSLKNKTGLSRKTILVTDSGLGGMSVFARIAAHLKKKSPWQDVSMVYFNAWPEQYKGYNHFKTMDQRADVFNNALYAMENFNPDMILIACNTLSVIYPFTPYSHDKKTQVSGIVDHGVQLIQKSLISDPDRQVIIFGTPTTIAEKSHQRQLVKMGIDPKRIINQGCTNLAGKIERDPFSQDVSKMIHTNVSKAVSKIKKKPGGRVYAALCCTHFGYCKDLFKTAISGYLKEDVIILNPNKRMADHAISDYEILSHDKTDTFYPDIDMKVISRVFWEPERINAYVRLLKDVSPEVVNALAAYEWNPNLFEV
jgi:glutamate racemase